MSHFIFGKTPSFIIVLSLQMGKLKLRGVKIRNRSGFIISFSQLNIYWALITEFQVILDIGVAKMNKMFSQSSATQPVLSLLFSSSLPEVWYPVLAGAGQVHGVIQSWASPTQSASL